jgi:hypothetical protein
MTGPPWILLRRRNVSEEVAEKINPLNVQLNPICHLLALLGAHLILYVSRIRVKEQNFMFSIFFYLFCL